VPVDPNYCEDCAHCERKDGQMNNIPRWLLVSLVIIISSFFFFCMGGAVGCWTGSPTILDTRDKHPTRIEWYGTVWVPAAEEEVTE